MEVRKMRQLGQIACGLSGAVLISTPAFAQESAGLDLVDMFAQMGAVAWGVAVVLFIMSFWSVGIAIERIYTYNQARKQSKMYAPQVAKHLKEGRLKDAIAISQSKSYQYSHLAKVVLAGLQEYQFQQDANTGLSREDLVDTVRRAIQRATALTANDLKKGIPSLAPVSLPNQENRVTKTATSASWISAPAANTPVPWRTLGPYGISMTTRSSLSSTGRSPSARMMLPPDSAMRRFQSSYHSSSNSGMMRPPRLRAIWATDEHRLAQRTNFRLSQPGGRAKTSRLPNADAA